MAYCTVEDVQKLIPEITLLSGLSEEIGVESLACVSGRPIALAGTGNSGKIFRSADGGIVWSEIGQLGTERHIKSLVGAGSSVVIAGTSPGGKIYRSEDYGVTWSDIGQLGEEEYVNALAFFEDEIVLAGTSPAGKIYRSVTNGETWSSLGQIVGSETGINSLEHVSSSIVLAGTSPGGKILRSEDYGVTWSDIGQLGSEEQVKSLVGAGSSVVIAGTSPGGKIYRSEDYGVTWSDIGQLGSEESVLSLAYLGSSVVVAGTEDRGHIFYSTDNGVVWYDQGKVGYSKVYSFANLQFDTILIGTGDIAKIFLSTSVLKIPYASYPANLFPGYFGSCWNEVGLGGDILKGWVEGFIAGADAEINSYLSKVAEVPFDPVPEIIKWISERLAAAEIYLWHRRFVAEASNDYLYEKQLFLRQAALEKLELIVGGEISTMGGESAVVSVSYGEPQFGEVDSDSVFDELNTAVREA